MSYDYRNPQLGEVVYPSYGVCKAGIIIEIGSVIYPPNMEKGVEWVYQGRRPVTILQSNGKKYDETASNLKDYRDLILNHERKLQTHREVFDKILRGAAN